MPAIVQTAYDIGDHVECDFCSRHFDAKPAAAEIGGIVFETKAACPDCAPRIEDSARRYHETKFIRARARAGETFRDFCLRIRASNMVVVSSGENIGELIETIKTGGLINRPTANRRDEPI